MLALVDADSLLYKVGFAIEDKVIWNQMEVEAGIDEETDVEYYTNLSQCRTTFNQLVSNIQFATDCDDTILVFSGGHNFRLDLPSSYKENRKASRKPLGYSELLEYAQKNYETITTDGIEADDLVVWMKTEKPEDYILCAIDKDVLYQTGGTHYNYGKDEEVTVDDFDAKWFAYYQTLTGDTSDGYKGCKGIGDKKARKILDGLKTDEELWKAVVETYESKGQDEDEALWTMRLANMHQWNGTEIVLWNPPVAPE
jgi:DNA polymerase-1